MQKYCDSHPETFHRSASGLAGHCYSAWSLDHTYMILLIQPGAEPARFNIFCYQRRHFDHHLYQAKAGMQFRNLDGTPSFYLEDGDSVMIEHRGMAHYPVVAECRFVTRDLFDIGGELFSAEAFASLLDDRFACAVPMRASLPSKCFYFNEVSGNLMEILKGCLVMELSPLDRNSLTRNREMEISFNRSLGLSPAQVKAMHAGALYGWEYAEADPANYDTDGNFIVPKE